MKPWDKQLDEKLQQALNRLQSDVTDAQWLHLAQKLDALDKMQEENDEKIGAPLQSIEGQVTDSQWVRLADRLDAIDHIKRRGRFALWLTALLTCLLTTAALTGWWYWHSGANSTTQQAGITKPAQEIYQPGNKPRSSQAQIAEQRRENNQAGNNDLLLPAPSQADNTGAGKTKGNTPNGQGKTGKNNRTSPDNLASLGSSNGNPPNNYFNTAAGGSDNLPTATAPQAIFNPQFLGYIGIPARIRNQHIPGSPLVAFPVAMLLAADKVVLPDPFQRLPRLYIQLGVVSEYNMNKPSGDNNPLYSHRDAQALKEQQVNNGFTVGIKTLAGYRLGSRLRFNVGFSLQQQVEQATVNYTYNRVPFKDANGQIIGYFDLPTAQWKRYNFTSTKTQLLAEIPVQIGTELPLGRKMVIAPRIGIDTRLVMAASGSIYNIDKNQVETLNKQSVSRFNFGWNVNLACYYRLNQRIWISAEPYYLQVAKPLAPAGAVVQQTQSSLGLNLFLTYSLVK